MNQETHFNPIEILKAFDEFLANKKVKFEAILIGSGAMNILGVLHSRTRDLDILDPKIPAKILELAEEFRSLKLSEGIELHKKWLNNGPASLLGHLPQGWTERVQPLYKGKAIIFVTLGRLELLMDKLWGFCDVRPPDKEVILNLKPTRKELKTAAEWVKRQEANPQWPAHVDQCVEEIEETLFNER